MKIILISGKARSGKDTSADYLKKELKGRTLVIHYADYLKYICRQFYGWDGKKDEAGRTLLQLFGNTVRLKSPDFWVNTVIDFLEVVKDDFDYVIIPDVRYTNEIELIEQRFSDVITLRIERPGYDNGLTSEQKAHISETCLDSYNFDYWIINDGGLPELFEQLYTLKTLFC